MDFSIVRWRQWKIRIRPLFEEGLTEEEQKERERLVSMRSTKLLREIIKWVRPHLDYNLTTKIISWFKHKYIGDPFPWPCEFLRDEVGLLLPILSNGNDDVTFADENGGTILHLCILHYMRAGGSTKKYNYTEREKKLKDSTIVQKFISMGASVIARDHDGKTPLGLAIEKQRIDLVDTMLKCFDPSSCAANVNDLDQTVLHVLTDHCYYAGHDREHYVDMIMRWSKYQGTLTRPDKNGLTPLHLIVKHFKVELLEMFDDYDYEVDCDVRETSEGDDLLIFACKHINARTSSDDHLYVINWLLKRGCHVNCKNHGGFAALHYALQSSNLILIDSLLGAGADPRAVTADGTNALYPAAMLSSFEVMRHFIESGVESNCRDTVYGFTLMHMAALSLDEAKFEWLVDNGFELDDCGRCGVTPLHLASMVGNAKIVQKLIDRDANVHRRDKTRRCTPLHLASMRGGFLTVKDLNATGLDDEKSSLIAHCFDFLDFKTNPKTDYKSVVVALLKAGAKVNVKDSCGRTPLHYATQRLFGNIVEILLAAGAYVDVQDKQGFTPLHNCLIVGWGLDSLITFGADISDVEHPSRDILKEIKSQKSEGKCYMISKQLKKLKAARLPIGDACKTWDDDSGNKNALRYLHGECWREVLQMKKYMLTSDVSLYDLLHMKPKRRLTFVNSLPSDLQREFPFFYPMIRGSCHEAVTRESLLKSAKEVYQFLTGYQWPDLCMEHIFSFLSNKSLRALIDSVTDSSTDCINLEKLSIMYESASSKY